VGPYKWGDLRRRVAGNDHPPAVGRRFTIKHREGSAASNKKEKREVELRMRTGDMRSGTAFE